VVAGWRTEAGNGGATDSGGGAYFRYTTTSLDALGGISKAQAELEDNSGRRTRPRIAKSSISKHRFLFHNATIFTTEKQDFGARSLFAR